MELGKSWKFFFGGLDILSGLAEDSEKAVMLSELGKEFEPTRKKVIEAFNKSKVFANVSDLFVTPPEGIFLTQ